MTAPTDLQSLPSSAHNQLKSSFMSYNSSGLQELGAELAFTQDAGGQYLSFYWQEAEGYGLCFDEISPSKISKIFVPVEAKTYLQRVRQVLERLIPERFSYEFEYAKQIFRFDLVVSPILTRDGAASAVLVMGRQVTEDVQETPASKIAAASNNGAAIASSHLNQKLLGQLARNIRRTLDLDTIWQQTVDGLGEALGVCRCLVSPYKKGDTTVIAIAEYRREGVSSILGQKSKMADLPAVQQALDTLEPVAVEGLQNQMYQEKSVLVVATHYKDKPNGLICLHQCDYVRQWQAAEIELMREIAEQVGTAIAHATLYEELKEARIQAEESSRLKSEFLANTSHELRTPLNGMIGFLKLILEGMAEDPEEKEEFIQEAYRSAIHLLNIINDILDIAKIEAGKMELELGPVKLKELFNRVADFTRTQAQQKNLSLRFQIPAAHDEIIVNANYQRLLQVMLNLVGNALKFTHDGGVTVTAEVIQKKKVTFQNQEFPGIVKVRVADTGIGVSLEKQDKLFQKFTQVDGGLNRAYGGTGLGLTISQKLVETMGGTVNFYSMGEGLGSTVTFSVLLYQEPLLNSNQPIDPAVNK